MIINLSESLQNRNMAAINKDVENFFIGLKDWSILSFVRFEQLSVDVYDADSGIWLRKNILSKEIMNILQGERIYLPAINLDLFPSETQKQILNLCECILRCEYKLAGKFLWVGPKKTITNIHFDHPEGFLAQIYGEKKAILFNESDKDNLYFGAVSNKPNWSPINFRHPDTATYPKYQDVKYKEYILRAGDILYIPKEVPHYIESLSESISINFWWSKSN